MSEKGGEAKGGNASVTVEGRVSNPHPHSDGTFGRDVYAAKVTRAKDGSGRTSEKNHGWGHAKADDGSW